MPRPPCSRRIAGEPGAAVFKPVGIPVIELEEVVMALDEFEALRLADLDGLYQDVIALRMGISRPTVGRILESARRKVADALVHGKALRIDGGPVHQRGHQCCRWHDEKVATTPPGGNRRHGHRQTTHIAAQCRRRKA
jgi:uncharacterized protein